MVKEVGVQKWTVLTAVMAVVFLSGCAGQLKDIKKREVLTMSIYDITVKDMAGKDAVLSEYKGKVLLIVNTATHCGFTPQYPGLQALYAKYKDKGFEILDFPCNQFMGQAPEGIEEYHNICTTRFGVTFRQFAKIDVNGNNESPLYTYLKKESGGKNIGWNFTKFLVDRQGKLVKRFESADKPETMDPEIAKLLE
jgi:glutathione peroxidase